MKKGGFTKVFIMAYIHLLEESLILKQLIRISLYQNGTEIHTTYGYNSDLNKIIS